MLSDAQQPVMRLDISNHRQEVTLIRVPHFLAQSWLAAMDSAPEGAEVELGQVIVSEVAVQDAPAPTLDPTEPPGAQQLSLSPQLADDCKTGLEYGLQLSGIAQRDVPLAYRFREQETGRDVILALTEHEQHVGVLGHIRKRYDAEVAPQIFSVEDSCCLKANDGQGRRIDSAYRALTRARHESAAKKTRTMQVIDDPTATLRAPGPLTVTRNQKKKDDRGHEHRARSEKQPLEAKLFRLFGKQERWKFADLQQQTAQPTIWLKEILTGIGILNRKGPHMGLWELQREFRGVGR